jgi:uncharacterized glyoxalase superfamily protein PhnB
MANDKNSGPNIFPAVKYTDGASAVEWLAKAFGFERKAVFPGADGQVAHAELSIGPGVILLGTKSAPDPKNPWADATMGIYVYVEDVDGHHARAKAAGAEIVRDLADTEYGSREYSARDTEGNLWSFGTYRPGGG